MLRNFLKGFFSFFLMIIIICAGVATFVFIMLQPVNQVKENQYFTIEYGSTKTDVVWELADEGLIKSYDIAKLYVKYVSDANFLAGTYQVKDSMSTLELIDYLSNEDNIIYDTVDIRIIEGTWLEEIADKVSAETAVTKDELLRYWKDPDVFSELMEDYPFLTAEAMNSDVRYYFEGYLFPDTYTFLVTSNAEQVTRKMLDRTLVMYEKYQDKFAASKYSIHQLFTLASIVQFEAGVPSIMKTVASVFYNRLARNYRLESSVTVCYAIGEKGNVCELTTSNEKSKNNPYNTYYHAGLTPGPITSSGEDAFVAVLEPDNTDYMFFLAKDGTVYFSRTYEEHCALGGC